MAASRVLAAASPPAPAQLHEDSAGKGGDTRRSLAAPKVAALRLDAKPKLN
jgi:hypothetical protein